MLGRTKKEKLQLGGAPVIGLMLDYGRRYTRRRLALGGNEDAAAKGLIRIVCAAVRPVNRRLRRRSHLPVIRILGIQGAVRAFLDA